MRLWFKIWDSGRIAEERFWTFPSFTGRLQGFLRGVTNPAAAAKLGPVAYETRTETCQSNKSMCPVQTTFPFSQDAIKKSSLIVLCHTVSLQMTRRTESLVQAETTQHRRRFCSTLSKEPSPFPHTSEGCDFWRTSVDRHGTLVVEYVHGYL